MALAHDDRTDDITNTSTAGRKAGGRLTVTSAEFVRQFGHWRQYLGSSPLLVTHHGRATHVFLTTATYEALDDAARDVAPDPSGLPDTAELADWMAKGVIVCDHDLVIKLVNASARALADRLDGELAGRRLWDSFPELEGSLAQIYIRRTVQSGERSSAEIPGVFRPDTWLRLEVTPFSAGFALLLTDITDDVRSYRLADVPQTLVDTISRHPGIGHGRLTVRGEIESVDAGLCVLLQRPESTLRHQLLADLATPDARAALVEAIGQVLRQGLPSTIETELQGAEGEGIAVTLSLTQLRGAYGAEGAVLALTRR